MNAKKRMAVLSVLSVTASLLLPSGGVRAAEVCDTVEACRALQAGIEARPAVLSNTAPNLTDIVRKADGSVLEMTYADAVSYCQSQGQRLPSARELALYAQSLGAEGISETAKNGYKHIGVSDSAGHPVDHFYYRSMGYQPPDEEHGEHDFWSSSSHPDFPADWIYKLNGKHGLLYQGYYESLCGGITYCTNAVRCVKSR